MSAPSIFGLPLAALNHGFDFMGRRYEPGEVIDTTSADPRRIQLLLRQGRIGPAVQAAGTTFKIPVSAAAQAQVQSQVQAQADHEPAPAQESSQEPGNRSYTPQRKRGT